MPQASRDVMPGLEEIQHSHLGWHGEEGFLGMAFSSSSVVGVISFILSMDSTLNLLLVGSWSTLVTSCSTENPCHS